MDVTESVAAGLAWLQSDDARERGFDLDRVQLDRLDMADGYRCVLAQAHRTGIWSPALDDTHEMAPDGDMTWYREHGFLANWGEGAVTYESYEDRYNALQAEWLRVLADRQEAAPAA